MFAKAFCVFFIPRIYFTHVVARAWAAPSGQPARDALNLNLLLTV